ncbi:MAG: hypothetical protein AB8G05_18370 [Oligoflexales bacterium]
MHSESVTNFFAKEAEKNLQKKLTILLSSLLFVVSMGFIYAVSIPKTHLNYAVHKDRLVLPFSKVPPAIRTSKNISPEILLKKSKLSKHKLSRLKKIYKVLVSKKSKEKNVQKKLNIVLKSIKKEKQKINSLQKLLSQK